MAAKTLISNSRHKGIFHKIWLISEDCKNNYIAERKIVKSYLVALLWGRQILKSACKMLIYTN